MTSRNKRKVLPLSVIAVSVLASVSTQAAPTLVDWSSGNGGTLPEASVSITGSNYFAQLPRDQAYLDRLFNRSTDIFTGPVSLAEAIEVVGSPGGNSFTVSFSAPVSGVVLHLASLASTLTFDRAVFKLSGEDTLAANGNQVSGVASGSNDSSGSILIGDVASSFSFTAVYVGGNDGIGLQMYSGYVAPAVPEPGTYALMALGLLATVATVKRRAVRA